jgi:hypothetical protein
VSGREDEAMKNAFLAAQAVLVVGLAAATVALFVRTSGVERDSIQTDANPASPEVAAASAASGMPADDRVDALEARLAALEREMAKLTEGAKAGRKPEPGPQASSASGASASGPAAPGGEAASGTLTREDVRKLVGEELERRYKEWGEQAAASWTSNLPKKTIEEVSRELNLGADAESKIRTLYRDLEKEGMMILFGVKDEAGLEALKAQLREAEVNPELKGALREKIVLNWTLYQNQVSALYVKADSALRKILEEKKLQEFYKYDVHLSDPEFPDIEKMFFSEDKKEK